MPDPNNNPVTQSDVQEQKPQEATTGIKEEIQTETDSLYKGDGSSPILGKNETTFSAGDAVTEVKPNYLKNPVPPYPREALEKGWQGVVLLKVIVNKFGRPKQVEKEQSSGYAVLDETAVRAVKRWHFHPATLGTIPIESSVSVPIRFVLAKKTE